MNIDKTRALIEMGIKPLWRLRESRVPAIPATQPVALEFAALQIPTLAPLLTAFSDGDGQDKVVADAPLCVLCASREHAVLGADHADWMFVAGGLGDDQQGLSFAGQAGQLLDAMLHAIALKRTQNVYLAQLVACRSAEDRTAEADAFAHCKPYLAQQIDRVKPKLIVALGQAAAETLLGKSITMAEARGTLHRDAKGVAVIVTYAPQDLLQAPANKARAWEDLCFALDQIDRV